MTYIGYPQIEELLRKYAMLKALLSNLQVELSSIYASGRDWVGTQDDYLYTMSVGNKVLSDMPAVFPNPGDKATNIIATDGLGEEYHALMNEIMKEINTVWSVIERVDGALKGLAERERQIVTDFYREGQTWKEICATMMLPESFVKEIRKKAIEKMVKLSRITAEEYDFCVGKV
jgi:hypothetical protein